MKICIDTDHEVRTLRGGIGACWHAISMGTLDGQAGSAWGGNPPAESEQWQELYRYADWLGMSFVRAEIEQLSYQPERDTFTWESEDMLALRRILDWAQSRGVDVFLQQMWSNVEWNRYPDVLALRSAPVDLEAFSEGLAALVEKVIRDWGYSCVKWLCITNEPEREFSWWQGHGNFPLKVSPGLKAVREALDRRGIDLPLAGPDYTGMDSPISAAKECNPWLGAFDLHSYLDNHRLMPVGQSGPDQQLKAWVDYADSQGKPLFFGEFGSMKYGWYTDSPAPGGYFANLANAEIILRALRLGVEGFLRWSFTNRGNLDGQWQLVDTWDRERNELLAEFSPHANAYWLFGLVTRFFRKHSILLRTKVDGIVQGWQQYLLAEALRSPDGHFNVFVLCHTEQSQSIEVELAGLDQALILYRYRITEAIRNQTAGVRLDADAEFRLEPDAPILSDTAPGLSLTVYSSRNLPHASAVYGNPE